MDFLSKLAIWLISFPINLVIITYLFITQFISALFDLPLDIWNGIDEYEDEEEDA